MLHENDKKSLFIKTFGRHLGKKVTNQMNYRATLPMLNQVEMNLKVQLIWNFQHRLRNIKVIIRIIYQF